MEYWTEVMADVVLNGSRNIAQFLYWYCVNSIPDLSLVISEIYDALKRPFEYYEYFESF